MPPILIHRFAILFLVFFAIGRDAWVQETLDGKSAFQVIQDHCIDCHGPDGEAGLNLKSLFESDLSINPNEIEHWVRVERIVASGGMPPANEEALSLEQKETILASFRNAFVFRAGKEQVGQTPLRRLTRYELQNSLADLLAVELAPPYVVSSEATGLNLSTIEQILPDDLVGESGFSNDANRLLETRVPFEKLIACIDYALRIFEQDEEALEKVLGSRTSGDPLKLGEVQRILSSFLDRSSRGQATAFELRKLLKIWQDQRASGENSRQALLHTLKIALLSPAFL
ncbi:MAG: DUF1587 domain-containing protein, partial [Planctomycetota bacterium]|nr:DUF1587 domain-containing protein [Planctomycetota bacterium]